MTISAIVATSTNGAIGFAGGLPWHLRADLRRFRRLTTGHAVVMGRKTYESIGRPLPERTSIVLTRNPAFSAEGVLVAHRLDEALAMAAGSGEIFIIGGADVYEQALPRVEKLYVTRVHAEVAGDVFFPQLDGRQWRLVTQEHHRADTQNDYDFTFEVLQRVAPL